jgi:hypothetical protein
MEETKDKPSVGERWFATDEAWARFNAVADTLTPFDYGRFLANIVAASIAGGVTYATVNVIEEAKARL